MTTSEGPVDGGSWMRSLEQRVRVLEDHNAIMRLMYSYGPSVDSGLAAVVAGLWTEDGVYDVDTGRMDGRHEIANMVRTHPHQGFIQHGCGHVMSPAHITVDGDTAVAVCHTQLILRLPDGSGYQVSRVTANRWELIRTVDGWRVTSRTSRILDGQEESRAILASAFDPADDGVR
ncbi:nuclear transport factor 2 family protein [Rhodococcus olei]|uniref:Nuclear transport factor 2 family protein n=1 Tax=Rhodococcus olei TaxID=2161675 RepID=A0ABP8NYG6_9NOCA